MDKMGEPEKQVSVRMSELERAFCLERENLLEEKLRTKQEPVKTLELAAYYFAKILLRVTPEAKQREQRLI